MQPKNAIDDAPTQLVKVRVWDLPTRVFHWTLAACVVVSLVSAKLGGNAMEWHLRVGLVTLALLAFRITWGLLGGHWSRFARFLYSPVSLLRHVRGQHRPGDHFEVGHSPLGSLSVFALLGLLSLQVATGLVSDDEIAFTGPLIAYVSSATSELATSWHRSGGEWLIYGLVGLHLAAIAFYRKVRQRDLVGPMWHGDKWLESDVPASADGWRHRLLALGIAIGCGVLAVWIARQGS